MFPTSARALLARLLRNAAMAVLLLAVLGNPVLAAVGDTHEAARGAAEHLHEQPAHGDDGVRAGADGDRADLLEALAHAAHCCGHLSAVLPVPLPAVVFLGPAAAPSASLLPAASARPATLIRPPILI